MKKILLLTRNLPPLTGGMERLNHHLYLELKKHFAVLLAGPNGSRPYLDSDTLSIEFPFKPVHEFLWSSFWKTLGFCGRHRPDLIIAGSGATALPAKLIGYFFDIPVVSYLHGLDLVLPNRFYQMTFLPAIRASDAIWVNSRNTERLALDKRIAPDKIRIVYPGVTMPQTALARGAPDRFKSQLGYTDDVEILLSVGRLTERKGLPEFIRNCLPAIVEHCPRCVLVIIGREPSDALHHKIGVKERIENAIEESGLQGHVRLLGQVDEGRLAQAYRASRLHIFPGLALPGDVEGFGMVAIEAAAHGLATVAFGVGGVAEAVGHGRSGWLIQAGDYLGMAQTVIRSLNRAGDPEVNADSCRAHAAQFSWALFGDRVRFLCSEVLMK